MSSLNKSENNNNIDVWSSIRNIKKKIRGSKTENEISSLLQKSQTSTKLSSNISELSQAKSQKNHEVSHFDENPSNYCSGKTSNDEEIEKSQIEDLESHFSLKHV